MTRVDWGKQEIMKLKIKMRLFDAEEVLKRLLVIKIQLKAT